MGKSKKIKVSKREESSALGDQIMEGEFAEPTGRVKERKRKEEDEEFVNNKLSKSIIQQARIQAAEMEKELGIAPIVKSQTVTLSTPGVNSDDEDDDMTKQDLDIQRYDDEEVVVDEHDELAVIKFMNRSEKRRTLAEIIQDKIAEKKTEIDTQFSDAGSQHMKDLNPKVIEMYEDVGKVLSKYRSGKVPKAFKVIAQFRNWEQLLYITGPESWSAAAMYQATRIFTANLKEKMAQRFFNLILLPRVRDAGN